MQWLKNMLKALSLRRKVNLFGLQLSELREEQRRNGRELMTRRKELDIIKEALLTTENRLRETVEESVRLEKKSKIVIEGLQDKIRIYEELTIPGLEKSGSVLLARWDTELSIQSARRAGFEKLGTHEEGD